MAPRRIEADQLASILPPGGLTLVQGASGESQILAEALRLQGEAAGDMTVTGIFVAGLNKTSWLPNAQSRVRTYFLTPELRKVPEQVEFLPYCYADILQTLRQGPIHAALFPCSPPDENGICSFGPIVDYVAELWPHIPVRIAQISNSVPRVHGQPGIPFKELTGYIEHDAPLLSMGDDGSDPASTAIGNAIAAFVPDGATLQTGLGRIPGAVLRALKGHKNLRIHSGLIGDAALELAESGAMAPGAAVLAGVAIGSERLYQGVASKQFEFRPVSVTHSTTVLAGIPNLVTVNSAISVDLFGQAFAELTPRGLMSGPGGASDFARGAKAGGGLRIVALPAAAKEISRIVPAGQGQGPVSLGRMDVDIVVTEYGAADLRGIGYHKRAEALINISAPAHRETLAAAWAAYAKTL